jgi:hypothetical protein
MKIYITNTGTRSVINMIKRYGWGRVHLANQWRNPEVGVPWILDNGAFSYWKNKLPFNNDAFEEALIKTEMKGIMPDFVVVPDIVAGGYESLDFSLKWLNRIPASHTCYLAVQDKMEYSVIQEYINLFDGIFVGGTMDWKLKTAKEWVKLAHMYNKLCHIGQVGTFRRLVWAQYIGADSIDSSTFVQAKLGRGFQRIHSMMKQTYLGRAPVTESTPR